jgi:hypothetical protein
MHPMLIAALVGPRQDDLRKSARAATAASRVRRAPAPALPLPRWTRTLAATEPARLAAEPLACGATRDAA